jgi:hypothetical protein
MANRFIRNTFILVKTEVTYGTDSVPTGAANAMLVSNVAFDTPVEEVNVDRSLITGFMGNYEQLTASRSVPLGFDIELTGSGTAGTAPAWSAAMKASGWAEAVTASTRVDYTPVSTGFPSATVYVHDDGVLHKITGWRGTVTIRMNLNNIPVLSFQGRGLYNAPTAAANPVPVYTAFKQPQIPTNANSGMLTFGATHTATGAPTLTGGTTYPSQGIEYTHSNTVEHEPLIGSESVEITDRAPNASFMVDAAATEEVAFLAQVTSNTLQSVGFTHGTVVGQKVLLYMPSVQLINPRKAAVGGKRLVGFAGRVIPSAGNDEVRLCTSF